MSQYRIAVPTLLAVLVLGGTGTTAVTGFPPPAVVPSGLGVNIHFTDPREGEMKMLAEAGFRWVRMDLSWESTEREKGKYDFSAYDRLLAAITPHGIKALFILDYANPLYDSGRSPYTGEGRKAFARWAAAAVKRFAGRGIIWEMYNEPNIGFWKPSPDPAAYVSLAIETGKAIRKEAPKEACVGPAVSGVDLGFLERCLKDGLLEYWDAVTVHPYRAQPPETALEDYRMLRALIARYVLLGDQPPVMSGEWGYSTALNGLDPAGQGRMLARMWLTNLAAKVRLSIWYDWHDDGEDPKDPECNFGTVRFGYRPGGDPVFEPKPAWFAARALTSALGGFEFNKMLFTGRADDYVLLFTRKSEVRIAAWTTARDPHPVRIPASPGRFLLTGCGGEELDAIQGILSVTLTGAPVYIAPAEPNDVLRVAAEWERVPDVTVRHGPSRFELSLRLYNPLDRDIRIVHLRQERVVKPGEAIAIHGFSLLTRAPHPVRVPFECEMEGAGLLAQETMVTIHNPLGYAVLPATRGVLPIRLDNPTGEILNGTVTVGQVRGLRTPVNVRDFHFVKGETVKYVPFRLAGPLEEEYALTLQVADRRSKKLLDLPWMRFRPLDDFSRFKPGSPPDGYSVLPDGDAKTVSEQGLTAEAVPPGLPPVGPGALRITYRFEPGWKFVRVVSGSSRPVDLPGKPRELGMWIRGDGEGNIARMRFTDSTGQTFQPEGERMTWKGWRWVAFPLDGLGSGRWGGAGDGLVHYPILLDTLFLLDNPDTARPTRGEVWISSPTLSY